MGKFDSIMKYLGKEDSYTHDQIKNGIDAQERMDELTDFSSVTEENIANVERLISGNISDTPQQKEVKQEQAAPAAEPLVQVDPDVLKELENLDAVPPNLDELQARLKVTSYEKPAGGAEIPVEEVAAEVETKPVILEETPQFSEDIFEPKFRETPSFEELPVQELPAQELPVQEQPFQEMPAQELPAHRTARYRI